MNSVRESTVAGTFYTSDPTGLAASIDAMLAQADDMGPVPKAIIVPHAGHVYSGPIAASVYARVRKARKTITQVVLLGPSHSIGFSGMAVTSATTYRTPLGTIPIDSEAMAKIADFPGITVLNQAHEQEHSIEVQLPFLQRTLGEFKLAPLVVGDAPKEEVARLLEALWGDEHTLIVISSDLSHHHPYGEAKRIDANTSARIVSLAADLTGDEACGCRVINGLLHLARRRGYHVEQVDVRSSGDTAGDQGSVVGYGSYIITEKKSLPLPWRQRLLQVARESVLRPLVTNEQYPLNLGHFPPALREFGASFVTVYTHGTMRGCIGTVSAHRALVMDVANNAQSAAFGDPRFIPLTLDEYHVMEMHISVLSKPVPLEITSREELVDIIRPGVDGLILEQGGHSATYLPSVWEQIPDAKTFVAELRLKAGLPPDGWSEITRVSRYTTEEFS